MTWFRARLAGDVGWNYLAFALMATVGALLNLFIAGTRGVEGLGVFNQAYAVFVVAGQLATLGIHDSVQKHMAEHDEDPACQSSISRAGLLCVTIVASVVAAALWLAAPAAGGVTRSESVGLAIGAVAPGVLLFGLNKTLMGVLNGTRRMKAFAFGQSLRVLTILTAVVAIGLLEQPHWMLPLGFTLAEAFLFPILLLTTRRHWRVATAPLATRDWVFRHYRFGARALPNAFFAESFVRIDILMLGLFVADDAVGVYSFAAIFVEGLYQLPVVIRTVANPLIVRVCIFEPRAALASFARRLGGLSLAVFVPVSLLVYFGFPLLGTLVDAAMVDQSRTLLPVLFGGMMVASMFIPMDHVLLQAGMPGRQSLLMGLGVLVNIVLNVTLIPRFGIFGAACATALAYALSGLTLTVAAYLWLGMTRGLFLAPR